MSRIRKTESPPRGPRRPFSPWPLDESPSAPREDGAAWLPDGRIVLTQDGSIWMMPAQRGSQRVLLADLPYVVRHVDVRGA